MDKKTGNISRRKRLLLVLVASFLLDLSGLAFFYRQIFFSTVAFYCAALWWSSSSLLWFLAALALLVLAHMHNQPFLIVLLYLLVTALSALFLKPLLYETFSTVFLFASLFIVLYTLVIEAEELWTFPVICGNIIILAMILKLTVR